MAKILLFKGVEIFMKKLFINNHLVIPPHSQVNYNHGHKSWDTFAFGGRFPIHTGPTPRPSPHKQYWTRVSRIFSEFQLCIGWGEGDLQENFEKDALF